VFVIDVDCFFDLYLCLFEGGFEGIDEVLVGLFGCDLGCVVV